MRHGEERVAHCDVPLDRDGQRGVDGPRQGDLGQGKRTGQHPEMHPALTVRWMHLRSKWTVKR